MYIEPTPDKVCGLPTCSILYDIARRVEIDCANTDFVEHSIVSRDINAKDL